MDLLIVGAGTMGRWFADAMGSDVSISFADVDETTAREAADEFDADVAALSDGQQFDIVCFAVPMSVCEEAITTHAYRARQAVIDVTGEMARPLEVMARETPELERVSLHPLFAPENAPGNVAVVRDSSGPNLDIVLDRLAEAGNTLVETSASEHDELMEAVQAKAHAAILAFALASDDVPEGFSTPVYDALIDLVEQVTGGSASVYAEIQDVFDGAEAVAEAANRIAEADTAEFERLYRKAGEKR